MIGSCVGMSLINLFELSVPLIQAPMAGVATPSLAAAVHTVRRRTAQVEQISGVLTARWQTGLLPSVAQTRSLELLRSQAL